MNRTPTTAVCLVLVTSLACHAEQPGRLRFYKEIDRGDSAREEILAVHLDSDVYAGTQNGFVDLRVVDSLGEEVPYRLEQEIEIRGETVHAACPSRVVSLVENKDNSIEIVVARKDKAPTADGLVIDSPLKDYERQVTIYGSSDGGSWQRLVDSAVIFDYTRYMDIRNREIALPKNTDRRFRVVIEAVTGQKESTLRELTRQFRGDEQVGRTERTTVRRRPLRIDHIELWHNITRQRMEKDKKTDYPILDFTIKDDAGKKQTIVTVHTRREPLTAFTIQTTRSNFSRRAAVQVPVIRGVVTDWIEVGGATVSAVHYRGFAQEAMKIRFPEQRQTEYRIVIVNQDNPALAITGVAAEGNVYRAMFFAGQGATYQLFYDSELVEKPNYDTAALSVALGKGYQLVTRPLGPQIENPAFGASSGFQLIKLLDNRFFLGSVISLMVIFLAILLFRAGRHIEGLPDE